MDRKPRPGRVVAPDRAADRAVGIWLLLVALLVAAMILLGGATRLTQSGLSMVEWRPVTGWLPPLSEVAWQEALEQYRQYPEYQKVNRGMSLEAFKRIYWFEYAHRLLGRVIGLAFALPLLWFWSRRQLRRRWLWPLAGLFVLGGVQGAVGWWMVASGLVDRPDVSHLRLAAHLALALAIFAALLWFAATALRLGGAAGSRSGWAPAVLALIYVQAVLGAMVAGLDAGLIYDTFPLMGRSLVPADAWTMTPGWLNLLENPATLQFMHRAGAVVVLAAVGLLWWRERAGAERRWADALVLLVLLQAGLGIATLLLHVPLGLALAHQAGAVALLGVAVLLCRRLRPAGVS